MRWKLTRTYTLVTTAALLTAGVLALAFVTAVIQPRQLLLQAVVGIGERPGRDGPGANGAHADPARGCFRASDPVQPPGLVHTAQRSKRPRWKRRMMHPPGGLLVVVTDRQGRIVATLPPLADAALKGTPLTGPLASLASTALAGQQFSDEPGPGRLRIAQPVLAGESGPCWEP